VVVNVKTNTNINEVIINEEDIIIIIITDITAIAEKKNSVKNRIKKADKTNVKVKLEKKAIKVFIKNTN